MQIQAQDVETITKRIYIITDGNFQQYKHGGLAIHAWYSDGGDISTWGTEAEHMSVYDSFNPSTNVAGLWFKDITFDKAKNIMIQVYDWSNTEWKSSVAEVTPASNNYYRWYSTSGGTFSAVENSKVRYYAYLYDGTNWTTQEMSTEDGYIFTADIDNQTGYKDNLEVIFATSVVLDNNDLYTDQNGKWTTMYRPFNENQTPVFVNVTNLGGGCWAGNSNSLKLNMPVHYRISYNPYEWKYSISPYFTRTLPAAAEGYGTFSSQQYDVTVPEGLTAKYASAVAGGKITWEDFGANGIKAGQGALLKGTAGGEYKFTPATSAEAPLVNLMKAINEKKQLSQTEGSNTNYILSKSTVSGDAALGFYKVYAGGSWCAAGTAYLSVPSQQAPEYIVLGETTGIANVNRENVSDNQYYMLDGRRVAQPTKGLYIVNGKKVIIK